MVLCVYMKCSKQEKDTNGPVSREPAGCSMVIKCPACRLEPYLLNPLIVNMSLLYQSALEPSWCFFSPVSHPYKVPLGSTHIHIWVPVSTLNLTSIPIKENVVIIKGFL